MADSGTMENPPVSTATQNQMMDSIQSIADRLNRYSREDVKNMTLDLGELINNYSHQIYYMRKGESRSTATGFNINHVGNMLRIQYLFKTMMGLKSVRQQLRPHHLRLLDVFVSQYSLSRRFNFNGYDIRKKVGDTSRTIDHDLKSALIIDDLEDKLTNLSNAVGKIANVHQELSFIKAAVEDAHHHRRKDALQWLENSPFRGASALGAFVKGNQTTLKKLAVNTALSEMERITGIPYKVDLGSLDRSFKWYTLSHDYEFGRGFVKCFNRKDVMENRIKPYTFAMVKTIVNAETMQKEVDSAWPTKNNENVACNHLAELFFRLEKMVEESIRWNGIVSTSILWEHPVNPINATNRMDAEVWAQKNLYALLRLQINIFVKLEKSYAANVATMLPSRIKELIKRIPKKPNLSSDLLVKLERKILDLEGMTTRTDRDQLKQLCRLRQNLCELIADVLDITFLKGLADLSDAEFEARCEIYYKICETLQGLLKRVETQILVCYRQAWFGIERPSNEETAGDGTEIDWISKEVFDQVFSVVVEDMYLRLRKLDYSVIEEKRFRAFFDQALEFKPDIALPCLERLFFELHAIPKADTLNDGICTLKALLNSNELAAKESFFYSNESELQTLVNEVQDKLRKLLSRTTVHSRRLRFEIFGLADCYAGNLEELLTEVMTLTQTMTTVKEGDRIELFIEEIESHVLEAQSQTHQQSMTLEKVKELESKGLMKKYSDLVRRDLESNFNKLTEFLREINQTLIKVRTGKIQLGGKEELGHLHEVLTFHDLEKLKKSYPFAEGVKMDDHKKFAASWKSRNEKLIDVLKAGSFNSTTIPIRIADQATPGTLKKYQADRRIPLKLRSDILILLDEVMQVEADYLALTLNFIDRDHIRNQSIYQMQTKMMAQAENLNLDGKRELRRLWTKILERLNNYQPQKLEDLFRDNKRALEIDISNAVGHHFHFS